MPLHVQLVTGLSCLTDRQQGAAHCQKLYADFYSKILVLPYTQVIERVKAFD